MGSGSPAFTDNTGSLGIGASKVIYGQYQSLVFRDELTFFQFNTHTPDQIYVININRARYKHGLAPSSFSLHLSGAACIGAQTAAIIATGYDGTNVSNVESYNGSAIKTKCIIESIQVIIGIIKIILIWRASVNRISIKEIYSSS